jgi:hypothetical protein
VKDESEAGDKQNPSAGERNEMNLFSIVLHRSGSLMERMSVTRVQKPLAVLLETGVR